jgi:hypothetical protein
MAFGFRSSLGFLGGFVAGLGLASVTVVAIGAMRRMRPRHCSEQMEFIDGVRPPSEAELDARPAEEANSFEHFHLESEAIDVIDESQRW